MIMFVSSINTSVYYPFSPTLPYGERQATRIAVYLQQLPHVHFASIIAGADLVRDFEVDLIAGEIRSYR